MATEVTFKLNLKVDGKDVVKNITMNVEELRKAIDETKSSSEKFTSSLIKWNQLTETIGNFSSGMSQLSTTLNNVTAESRSFGAAMASANTMAGKSGEDFAALKDQVAELSKTIPIARDELANGLYQVISNGVPEDNWIEYLEKSAKASVGGIADLGETVKVTSTIIKNYGLDWSDAGSIQDKIQLTAKNGVTSFEQLAQALPRVTSNAATLGVSVDELMATFSTLTGVSGNTAEVSTQLAAIFTALVKPSSEAAEMAQQMGIQFDAAAIKAAGGMEEFLTSLDKSVKQYAASSGMLEQEIYGKLFGSAESLRALGPLTGQLADKFKENVADMKNSAGTIEDAFTTMASTGGATLQTLNNKFGALTDVIQSSIGNLLPYLNFGSQVAVTISSIGQLAVAIKTLGVVTKVTTVAMKAYRVAAIAATSLTVAPFLALAAGLSVVAVGYSKVGAQIEDTDRKARALKEKIAELKQEQENNVAAIKKYLAVAQDATKKTADRKEAISKLKALYPDYFKNLDIATSKQYSVAKAVNASNKAYRDQLVLIAKQAKVQYEKSKANYEKNQNGGQMGGTNAGMNTMMNQQDKANVEADLKAWKAAEQAVKDYDKAVQQPAKTTSKKDDTGTTTKKTLKVAEMNLSQVEKAIEQTETKLKNTTNQKQIDTLKAYEQQLQARKKALEKETGIGSYTKSNKAEPKFYKNPTNRQQYEKNISYYTGKLTNEDTTANQKMRENIKLWQQKVDLIDLATKKQAAPTEIKTHDDTKKVLDYLNFAHDKAATLGLDIQDINKKIAEVNLADAAIDRSPVLDSLTAIDNEIKYQQALKNTSSLEEQTNIDKEIKRLEALKQKRTELQKLQDRLSDAQENFDNATTVEAKVEASAEIAKIQKEIDESTKGKLTVEATVEPTYIQQGSLADKRQSYSNAKQKASQTQQDLEMGLIDEKEAKSQIDDINKQLESLGEGLKPIKIDIKAKNVEELQSLFNVDLSNFDSVSKSLRSIKSITDPTTQGLAAAGASCQALGQSMQQLGADSAAAKVGLIMAALGQIALSFAQALQSAASAGWIAWLAFGIAGTAQMISMISTISQFATGGIVGGNETSGDKVLVRVNSGEMILNAAQQARLFAIADGTAGVRANTATLTGMNLSDAQGGTRLVGKVRGRDIVLAAANETRSRSRRSNIRI